MNLILDKGHSRVPVYYEQRTNIIGLVLVSFYLMMGKTKLFCIFIIVLLYLHSTAPKFISR